MHGKVITIPEGHGFVMIDGRYYFGKTGAAYKAGISSCGKHGAFVRKSAIIIMDLIILDVW